MLGTGKYTEHRKSFTNFCKAIRDARSGSVEADHLLQLVYGSVYKSEPAQVRKTAMGETSGAIGGYTIPTEYSTQLLVALDENSIIYPRANVIPMGAAEALCPVFDAVTQQSAGISPFFGGMTFTWGFSQAPTNVADTAFRQVALTAWDLLGYGIMSNQWLQDTGPDGEQRLVTMIGRAAAWSADYAFLRGVGADSSMPLGMLNCPALIAVTRAGGNHIAQADIAKMWGTLIPSSIPRAIWLACPTAVEDLVKITGYQANNGTTDEAAGEAGTIYTRPVFITEKLPALGTVGDIMLVDPSLYAVGNRQEVLIDISGDVPGQFEKNRSVYRVWLRMAGLPQLSKKVRLADGSTEASAYVALAA